MEHFLEQHFAQNWGCNRQKTICLIDFLMYQVCICDHYSRAESNQGRKLLIIRRFLLRKLFKGGNYSRAETIRGNTVHQMKYVPMFSDELLIVPCAAAQQLSRELQGTPDHKTVLGLGSVPTTFLRHSIFIQKVFLLNYSNLTPNESSYLCNAATF